MSLNDSNVKAMSKIDSNKFLKTNIRMHAFHQLKQQSSVNKKTNHLIFQKFKVSSYIVNLEPYMYLACILF